MTPKEKAVELVDKYFTTCHKSSELELSWKVCKKIALLTSDEVLYALNHEDFYIQGENNIDELIKHYIEVKTEIEKL